MVKKISINEILQYLGLIIHKDGENVEYLNQRIRALRMNYRNALQVLCNRTITIKSERKFNKVDIRPIILYKTGCLCY